MATTHSTSSTNAPIPFTSLPQITPSTTARLASDSISLLPSPTPTPTALPLIVTTSSGTVITLTQGATSFTTVTSIDGNGATWLLPMPMTTASGAPTSTGSPGPNKTTTIILSTVVTIIGVAAVLIIAILLLRGRMASFRRRRGWTTRYPSQWSWDSKYHDAEPGEPTPLTPTSPANYTDAAGRTYVPATGGAYAFAPTYSPQHTRFPSSDLPRTEQPTVPPPPVAHSRMGSVG